ncbi:hypothetical protein GCM10027423_61640 [Spirosoma arcticum]
MNPMTSILISMMKNVSIGFGVSRVSGYRPLSKLREPARKVGKVVRANKDGLKETLEFN